MNLLNYNPAKPLLKQLEPLSTQPIVIETGASTNNQDSKLLRDSVLSNNNKGSAYLRNKYGSLGMNSSTFESIGSNGGGIAVEEEKVTKGSKLPPLHGYGGGSR